GGDVIVRAVAGTDSLADIVNRKHWRADNGGRGEPANCHGRKAEDLVIAVPPGTIIVDRDRLNILRDLTTAGDEVVVARGGRGGGRKHAFQASRERGPGLPPPRHPRGAGRLLPRVRLIAASRGQ